MGVTTIISSGTREAIVELRQSTVQHLRHRLSAASVNAALLAGGAAVLRTVGLSDSAALVGIAAAFGLPVVVLLWLLAFNRGPGALPSQVVEVSIRGIRVQRYDEVAELEWRDFAGVRVSGVLSRRIQLRAHRGRGMELAFHSLSSEQRRWLLSALRDRERTVLPAPDSATPPG